MQSLPIASDIIRTYNFRPREVQKTRRQTVRLTLTNSSCPHTHTPHQLIGSFVKTKKLLKIDSAKSRALPSFQLFTKRKPFSQFEVATREKRNGKIFVAKSSPRKLREFHSRTKRRKQKSLAKLSWSSQLGSNGAAVKRAECLKPQITLLWYH